MRSWTNRAVAGLVPVLTNEAICCDSFASNFFRNILLEIKGVESLVSSTRQKHWTLVAIVVGGDVVCVGLLVRIKVDGRVVASSGASHQQDMACLNDEEDSSAGSTAVGV
jgi:hypothetical protein